MYVEMMPLYPAMRPDGDGRRCVRVPMFGGDGMGAPGWPDGRGVPELRCVRRVTIENPCRPGECAEVLLGLDACGNLVVCVRRPCEPDPCPRPRRPCLPPEPCRSEPGCRRPPRPRGGCGRGRLYGTWR